MKTEAQNPILVTCHYARTNLRIGGHIVDEYVSESGIG